MGSDCRSKYSSISSMVFSMDFLRLLAIPEGKISPSFKVMSGFIFRTLPAIPATLPMRPPCFKYSMSPTVKKIRPEDLISSSLRTAVWQSAPLSRRRAASNTYSPCSTVLTVASITVICASG